MNVHWQPPTLYTPRLLLRALDVTDAEAVFAYASNPRMTPYTLWDTHRTIADSLQFVGDYARSRYREQVPEPMAVCLREEGGRLVGSIGCYWSSKPNQCMELGYALAEPYWGRGLVAEAAAALLDFVFAEYLVERVQAHCMAPNDASVRVMQKIGMTFEGTTRSGLFHRGRFWDLHKYAVLRGEWQDAAAKRR